MAMLGIFLIFNMNSYLTHVLGINAKILIYTTVVLHTVIMPLIAVFILQKTGSISSLKLNSLQERRIPYLFTAIMYFICYHTLQLYSIPSPIYTFILGAGIAIGITSALNFIFKISAHGVGIGGITGMIFSLGNLLQTEIIHFLVISIILIGIVGFSRLKLNAHSPIQFYSGVFLGFFCIYLTFNH